jgi:hypothetical protein
MVRALRFRYAAAGLIVAACPSFVHAAAYASAVLSYTPGTADANFTTPTAALGAPDGLSGENPAASNYFGFPNVLSPFSPAYQGDELVQIGEGGQITLRLSNYLNVGAGKRLGILSNVGLMDGDPTNFSGQNATPASAFGGGAPTVRVSKDNVNWVTLGPVNVNIPNLYYVNAGPYDSAPPASPQLTDFGKPFEGTLASFDGKDFPGTVNAFKTADGGYSGGGTWLDLSSTGLTQVAYVQLLLPDDNNPNTDARFALDALSIANTATGAPLPEPSLALVAITLPIFLRRRRNA